MCCVNGRGCQWLCEYVSITCYRCFSVCLLVLDILFSSAVHCFPDCYKIAHPQALGTTWRRYSTHWFHIYHLLRLGRAALLCQSQSAPTGSATFPAPSKGFGCLCPCPGLLCAAVTWGEMLWNKLHEICVEPCQRERPGRVVRATFKLRPLSLLELCWGYAWPCSCPWSLTQ